METAASLNRPRSEPAEVLTFGPMTKEKPPLQQVFVTEEGPLLRFACGILHQRETAEDIVQEAFLRLHGHWEEVANPRAWLYRTVRNLALNYLRDHKRETVTDEPPEWDATDGPEEALERLEAAGAVRLLLAELPEKERRLIHLKYHDEMKYEQISRVTGLSVGNVGYKLHHLLKGLADGLRRMGIESAEG